MEQNAEKFVSNFIEHQFPQFYKEEGQDFIIFVKAYYEWLESQGKPIYEGRSLSEYRDIDSTPEKFLEYFQKKYLYGIPFNIISNKRFILKHILDVYRSKGSIQCFRLLFKLIYNEDVEIYLPGNDILRSSESEWIEPRYIEVTNYENMNDFLGKTIQGYSSGTTAVVESITQETYNKDIFNIIYLTNVYPKGGDFEIGEKIGLVESKSNVAYLAKAPKILGSLDNIEVTFGGRGFKVGDTLQIVGRDKAAEYITQKAKGDGSLKFDLIYGGYGLSSNASTFAYKVNRSGEGASFEVGSVADSVAVSYNTDIIADYLESRIDSINFFFPKVTTSTRDSVIGNCLSYVSNGFGKVISLANVKAGSGYTRPTQNFIRSCFLGKPLTSGSISYSRQSDIVSFDPKEKIAKFAQVKLNRPTFNKPAFERNPTANVYSILGETIRLHNFRQLFNNDDVISLQASTDPATQELAVIKEVISANKIRLYGNPKNDSTKTAFFRTSPSVFPSNFSTKDDLMQIGNGVDSRVISTPNLKDYIQVLANTAASSTLPYGKDGQLVVTKVGEGSGTLDFELVSGGFGFNLSSSCFAYRVNTSGQRASFEVGTIADAKVLSYNTDVISDHLEDIIDSGNYNFPLVATSNKFSQIGDCLNYVVDSFGTISSLTNVKPGGGYTRPTKNFVRSCFQGKRLPGRVVYSTESPIVTYISDEIIDQYRNTRLSSPFSFARKPSASIFSILEETIRLNNFNQAFSNGDVIILQANPNDPSTQETAVIKEVIGANKIVLYGLPKNNSTSTSLCKTSPVILPSNFSLSEEIMRSEDGSINGKNENITSTPNIGSNVVKAVRGLSGKGYLPDERVDAYIVGQINPTVRIINGGKNYANTDKISFIDKNANRPAKASITTDSTGKIVSVTLSDLGTGYNEPLIKVNSKTGSGAIIKASVTSGQIDPSVIINENFLCSINPIDYKKYAKISGKVIKRGSGIEPGYWTTTKSHLNSDKYIQDSYYYQDYSYEIKVAQTLNKYKDILYETFHPAASEMFGRYYLPSKEESKVALLYSSFQASITPYVEPPPPPPPPKPVCP